MGCDGFQNSEEQKISMIFVRNLYARISPTGLRSMSNSFQICEKTHHVPDRREEVYVHVLWEDDVGSDEC